MGGGIGKMLCKKQGVDIVGAIDIGASWARAWLTWCPALSAATART